MDGILHIVSKDKDYWKNRKVGNITAGEDTLELTGGKNRKSWVSAAVLMSWAGMLC